jgi:hypothetical protein
MHVTRVNRRTFVQLSAGALLTSASGKALASDLPAISSENGHIRVQGPNYCWQYSVTEDRFTLLDSKQRNIVSGKMQPAVVVAPIDHPGQRHSNPGKGLSPQIEKGKATFTYEGVNGNARLSISWRFDINGIWTDPVFYESTLQEEIVSLHYFVESIDEQITPSLHPTFLIVPGIVSGSTLSPILHNPLNINQSFWLGKGSFIPGVTQQWALPVHYFCGFSTPWPGPQRDLYTEHMSDTFTLGLADLPQGDYFLQLNQGQASPWIDYRSDLWKHLRTPGKLTLGATMLWTVAPGYYGSIAAYYQSLLHAGVIQRKHNSAHKTAVALSPQFCTWGAQLTRDKANHKLDEAFLTGIYQDLKSSGMKAGLFSIDDKWESNYGTLVHSSDRLPNFEKFLAQLRVDGKLLGIWSAIMRCEKPSDLGLTTDHMLKQPDGSPYIAHGAQNAAYYILDFTQPEVAGVLTEVIRKFMRRYKPDLFKFDFGYELPSMSTAAPQDKRWAGERLLLKGLEVVIGAMRAESPDIVVMYYNLSPLLLEYVDLHSTDDLYLDVGDYQVEANRRIYFGSLLGPLGVPTYGSTGYDWSSDPSIWFDSAAVGSIGSLNDFAGDEQGEKATPELIAKYNGIAQVLRPTNIFEILPLGAVQYSPSQGAHARSWARIEDGQLVLVAWRPPIPGEENLTADATPVDPRVKDAIRSTVPVIVSSRTNEAIQRRNHLAIVSYGPGEIVLKREQGRRARITSHYFGGSSKESNAEIAKGKLSFLVSIESGNKAPLEWVEVRIV